MKSQSSRPKAAPHKSPSGKRIALAYPNWLDFTLVGALRFQRTACLPANMVHILLDSLYQVGIIPRAFFNDIKEISVNRLYIHQADIFQNILTRPIKRGCPSHNPCPQSRSQYVYSAAETALQHHFSSRICFPISFHASLMLAITSSACGVPFATPLPKSSISFKRANS